MNSLENNLENPKLIRTLKKDFFAIISLFTISIGSTFLFYQCKKAPVISYATYPANQVSTNTTVKWINKEVVDHAVKSTTGKLNSGSLNTNATFSHLFTTPGTYTYTRMTGTITVQ